MHRRRWALRWAAAVTVSALAGCTSQSTESGAVEDGEPASQSTIQSEATPTSQFSATPETTTSSPGQETPSESGDSESLSPEGPPSPEKPRTMTVVMSGDVLLHEGLWASAETDADRTGRGEMDFRPLLADMKTVISGADLAICHMETPLAADGGPFQGYPLFAAPPAIVPAIKWAGYDLCTTASNHSIDQGFEGLTRTLDEFEAAGIETVGTAATRRDSQTPLVMDVNGVKVSVISATYGTNGLPLPAEQPWSVPLIDTDKISALATKARDDGAEIVMVALHWGLEYTHPPTPDQLVVAEELARSVADIDLIYGHHAHVVQPYDRVMGTWVVYGLGNAVAQQDTAVEGVYDGNTARVTFTERPDGSFAVSTLEYIPTMITPYNGVDPMRWLNVPQSLQDPEDAAWQDALKATEQRVREVIGSLGAFKHGVVEGE